MTAQIVARLPVTYQCADGKTTHAPLIVTSVGGAAVARFILDTGSEVHLLNEDLVDELGLAKTPVRRASASTSLRAWRVASSSGRVAV